MAALQGTTERQSQILKTAKVLRDGERKAWEDGAKGAE